MKMNREIDSRLCLRFVRACFILAALVLAFGMGEWMHMDVYAGDSLPAGTYKVRELSDGWTVVTLDGSYAAHFEHTVAVTANGSEILTAFE